MRLKWLFTHGDKILRRLSSSFTKGFSKDHARSINEHSWRGVVFGEAAISVPMLSELL